jgi:hypothetical protein
LAVSESQFKCIPYAVDLDSGVILIDSFHEASSIISH